MFSYRHMLVRGLVLVLALQGPWASALACAGHDLQASHDVPVIKAPAVPDCHGDKINAMDHRATTLSPQDGHVDESGACCDLACACPGLSPLVSIDTVSDMPRIDASEAVDARFITPASPIDDSIRPPIA